jgi:hypothetical protein
MENNESCGAGRSANSAYVLDNAGKEAPARFAALAAILDPVTIRHLDKSFVDRRDAHFVGRDERAKVRM